MCCFPVGLGFPPPSGAVELFFRFVVRFPSFLTLCILRLWWGFLSSYISHKRLSLFKNSISLGWENVGLEPYTTPNLLFHKRFLPCLENRLIKTIPVIPTTYFMFALKWIKQVYPTSQRRRLDLKLPLSLGLWSIVGIVSVNPFSWKWQNTLLTGIDHRFESCANEL